MPTAKVDHVSLLELDEEDGVITRVVRRFRVKGLTDTDYKTLKSALDTAGVPSYDATLTGSEYSNLAVRSRSARLVEKGVVDVDVSYLRFENRFDSLQLGQVVAEFGGSVQQVTTNLDKDGNIVTLSYDYPSDYELDQALRGKTVEQGARINFLQPQKVMRVRGRKAASRVWLLVNGMVGKTNSVNFVGGAPDTWLCTTVRAVPADVTGTPTYEFEAEFQYAEGGWQPSVAFKDPNTGEPPSDLVENAGYKTVTRYEQAAFEQILQARIFGG